MNDKLRQTLATSRRTRAPIEFKHIRIDEDVRFGKARIGDTRFTVGDPLGYLSTGMSIEAIIHDFSELTHEAIVEGLLFAKAKEDFDNVLLLDSKEQVTLQYTTDGQ
ncbi:DUF433 domain-containing protein [Neolewinella antarctica]|uniref:Uncharacterized protein (DUF433 family) n=1 Tax=Neolewinella antarctica TaxID=442734 RepID=A0ABX0XDL8_9BACT|nr:DUF433 domain-containing protein [Neolewinella antarctica]NJC27307.1 uncharacterized protein (DUF433 family) [Neolewinella antarctica]